MKPFSYKHRPVHLGTYPLEQLKRSVKQPDLSAVPPMQALNVSHHTSKVSLKKAIGRYLAMMDLARDGDDIKEQAEIPADPKARSQHLKATSYFFDAAMTGIARLTQEHWLDKPIRNPEIQKLSKDFATPDFSSLAKRSEALYRDLKQSVDQDWSSRPQHHFALVFLTPFARDPQPNERGTAWIQGIQTERAALLNSYTAVVIANYIRLLGFEARAHTLTSSEVDLNRLAVSAGLCTLNPEGKLANPFAGTRFGLAAVTTRMELTPDSALHPMVVGKNGYKGIKWSTGLDGVRSSQSSDPYAKRPFYMGPHPYETLKRSEQTTTYIDPTNIPRFPKRADFFERAIHGDLGEQVQNAAKDVMYVGKSPLGACARRALGNLLLLQYGDARQASNHSMGAEPDITDAQANADNIKGACYFMSADAVGLCDVPDWAYYSHDAAGNPITTEQDQAICLLLDQGHETMEGSSGDDWVSVGQSMRSYLRFSLLGGVIAEHIRLLGHPARVHTVIDGDVLQPPLLLLAGLGEVSRIGEVILNPFLGPRLKSGVITTTLPMASDKPIDFGLQAFCEGCQKCARECPSGAITAGPKRMYNGYEIWKSDAEKCTRYRVTNAAGAMCGRCMKTCPWNLEGIFADHLFRWLAINKPQSAPLLSKWDDMLNRGAINPAKKWWWDIEINPERTRFIKARAVNARHLEKNRILLHEDQSLAVYPAEVMPAPYPVKQVVNRDKGIEQYRALPTVSEYRSSTDRRPGQYKNDLNREPPVFAVEIVQRIDLTPDIALYRLADKTGRPLPEFAAGAHIDLIAAPEYPRQYSLAGHPQDQHQYTLIIKHEPEGRGGSRLIHNGFRAGRQVFISPPRNHFPLEEQADFSLLIAGGIGVTPLVAMAHRLHQLQRPFLLYFCSRSLQDNGLADWLANMPWAEQIIFHYSAKSGRADFNELLPDYQQGYALYTCGSEPLMADVVRAGHHKGWPQDKLKREYFKAPEQSQDNHDFVLELALSGKTIAIAAQSSATKALAEAGIQVDTSCQDGLCGLCAVAYTEGDIDHRDFVLSSRERQNKMILCCSRASEPNGRITIEL